MSRPCFGASRQHRKVSNVVAVPPSLSHGWARSVSMLIRAVHTHIVVVIFNSRTGSVFLRAGGHGHLDVIADVVE